MAAGPVPEPGPNSAPSDEKDGDVAFRETLDKVRAAAETSGLKLPSSTDLAELEEELGEASLASLGEGQQDWLLVFSALCRLSVKDVDTQKTMDRRVALDLVLAMLQKGPASLKTSDPFIAILRNALCVSLISNSVSSIQKISDISLQIFLFLTRSFKDNLKPEIGIFIDEIVLRIMESGNSTYHHKFRALQVFYKLCADATTVLELFLNFDCLVDEKNIVERMIDCLSKIARGKYTDPEHASLISPTQEKKLRMIALRALVTLMGSILDWSREVAETSSGVFDASEATPGGTKMPMAVSPLEEEEENSDAEGSEGLLEPAVMTARSSLSVCEQKQRKRELQNGISKFNLKPKNGIEHLRQGGFVNDDPSSMAELFKNADIGLDKTVVGDYLGEDKAFNVSVLEALIADLTFVGHELDVALRAFLSLFRLPGEAQKISRIMEKFAEKYCLDNPGKFSHTDCAFVLAFSIMMLQTDLHNPGVKNKMTKDQFVAQNRGINNGDNLPREYLESLYSAVAANPMSLKEDDEARARMESQAAQGAQQKGELFGKESLTIVSRSKELMAQRSRKRSSAYVTARSPDHARPLFEVACWPMLATLSVLLEMHDEQTSVEECMKGFKHCVSIAVLFDVKSLRDAMVSALSKFTYLTTIKEIRQKNIECLKALLAVGLSEGSSLGDAWKYVLHCVSELDRLQILSVRAQQDFQYFDSKEGAPMPGAAKGANKPDTEKVLKRRAIGTGVSALMTMTPEDCQIELVNSESVAAQIDATQINRIFDRSERLDNAALVDFVTQLARVSMEELAPGQQPRIFSLQKLVEVASANMSRIPSVWRKIWHVLSWHFIQVANHPNARVGMYAIDLMRQLAKKCLESDELSNSDLQLEFLRPFEVVMTKTPASSLEVKELIVSSISILVFSRIQNVKSGWKTVFSILRAAVQEPGNEAEPETAFSVMEKVVDHHYELFVENFTHGIRALSDFAQSQANLDISVKATVYLQQAAVYLADKTRPDPLPPSLKDDGDASAPDAYVAHWFLILRSLSALVGDLRAGVRAAALTGVVHCLCDHGMANFDEEMWRMVFNGVIKPLFEEVHYQLTQGDEILVHIVSEVVPRGVKDLSPKQLAKCMPEIFPLLSRLVSVNSPSVRLMVQDILLEQVQPQVAVPAVAGALPEGVGLQAAHVAGEVMNGR